MIFWWISEGKSDGFLEVRPDGTSEGISEGKSDGTQEGLLDGTKLGISEGK